ncbi:hypothetical protein PILCRDRAFT_539477 [Piloderma croceum F 1598]|uniref:PAS domain-containing protein n=1 Tax=Piloderma croceum (strain F 1598) TaxID=765440 RepID=A0A0C3B1Z8_PILCF|nr:hypothetical protein PILCRDRAFT_539477 [Piloderma croceum F 1598]
MIDSMTMLLFYGKFFQLCPQEHFLSTDWALLSAGLDFIYLDPVLQCHLEAQASLLVGKSLLDFIHPDEHAPAEQDFGIVLESKSSHGSITQHVFQF